jgi:hypothetical protein
MTEALEVTDRRSAAVAVKPRVTLDDIKAAIAERYDINGYKACAFSSDVECVPSDGLKVLSICILVMRNGFTVIGKAAPASPENFNAELGRDYAYEDAVKQAWPLMGYALKDRLWRDSDDAMRFYEAQR